MFTKIENTLQTHAIFSEDGTHRYLLKKSWNVEKPTCTVITKFPNEEGTLFLDLTTHLSLNQLSKMDFGSVNFVNLYSNIKSPQGRKHVKDGYDEHTDINLMTAFKESETIILAYGSYASNPKVIPRIDELMEMLKPHKKKVKYLIDPSKGTPIHPLNPVARHSWTLK